MPRPAQGTDEEHRTCKGGRTDPESGISQKAIRAKWSVSPGPKVWPNVQSNLRPPPRLCQLPDLRSRSKSHVRGATAHVLTLPRNPGEGEQGSYSPVPGPPQPPCLASNPTVSSRQHKATLGNAGPIAARIRSASLQVAISQRLWFAPPTETRSFVPDCPTSPTLPRHPRHRQGQWLGRWSVQSGPGGRRAPGWIDLDSPAC